jgi:hypothetical protein
MPNVQPQEPTFDEQLQKSKLVNACIRKRDAKLTSPSRNRLDEFELVLEYKPLEGEE